MDKRMTNRVATDRQEGVVLFIALIVLVAMSFAGIAIMRSVGSGVLVASNLAFKQTTTAGAERGAEAAKEWLVLQGGSTLDKDNLGIGYYSSWGNFDPSTYNWNNNRTKLASDSAGTEVRYVIHRLCLAPNESINAPAQQCVMKSVSTALGAGSSQSGPGYGSRPLSNKLSPYYRVTVRSDGPKNSVSYVQVILD
jgi:type IV pilus assembly protein PilX